MKKSLFLVLLVIASGTATSVGKSYFMRSGEYTKQERLLAAYRASPEATLRKIRAAYLACGDSKYSGGPAASDIRDLAARLALEAISQRIERVDELAGKTRALQIMQDHLPAIKAKLDGGRNEDQILTYLQDLRKAGVASCVISFAA